MEIVKSLHLQAPPEKVWKVLLDPQAMASCVPGMESVEVLSETEYFAVMKVKISFISAKFKLKTRIVEMDAPNYLRAEGTGEDSSVASALKQVTEMWIRQGDDGTSELQIKVVVDLLGRMGTFGLSVMKTKADRMWVEFGENLAKRIQELEAGVQTLASPAPVQADGVGGAASAAPGAPRLHTLENRIAQASPSNAQAGKGGQSSQGFFGRLLARQPVPQGDLIRLQFRSGNAELNLEWPVGAAEDCRRLVVELARLGSVKAGQ